MISSMILLFQGVCLAEEAKESQAGPRYNIVFILVDALRADHVSCYGYFRKTTPNIDSFSKEGVLFENCITQGWYTLPSHASLFTSKYVPSHNVTEKETRLPESEVTLAEILKTYGYETAAFTGGIFFDPAYGLGQGFDTYYVKTLESQKKFPFHLGKSNEIIPKALDWIENNKNKNFFIFIHSYDLFLPCQLPATFENIFDPEYQGIAKELLQRPRLHLSKNSRGTYFSGKKTDNIEEIALNQKDIRHIAANYDAGILFSDVFVGVLLKKIKELNLEENTIIILTADHGTDLLEHKTLHLYMDGIGYDEVLRVPLIIKYPGSKAPGKRIKTQVQLIDLMPTILEAVHIPINKEAQGKSLLPLLKKGKDITGFNDCVFSGWGRVLIARSREWKLIYSRGAYELYNLREDPHELRNLAGMRPAVLVELIRKLFPWATETKMGDFDNTIELSSDLTEKLKKAGYW